MAVSLPFDFFSGLARRIAAPRVTARHLAAPLPLSRFETALYAMLAAVLSAGLLGVLLNHRSFMVGRVAAEEAERQSRPELLGDLICEENRVIGVSIQRVFDTALVERHAPRALQPDHRVLDGALAAAAPMAIAPPLDADADDAAPVVLQRAAIWRPRKP